MSKTTIQNNWREVRLGDVAEVIGGGTPKTSVSGYWNGNISWLTPRDLTNYDKTYIGRGERSITENGLRNSSARLIPKGSILLTSRAPIGYLAIAQNEVATNQGFKSMVANENKVHNIFLYYWLKKNVDYLKSIGTGSTFAEISGSVVKAVKICLPPLLEQKAIAEVLSSLDDKIDLLHRQNKTLEDLAQALFRKWFVEDADEGWGGKPLGEVTDIAIGRTPPRKEFQWFSKNSKDWKWVSIKDMGTSGVHVLDTSEYLTQEALDKFNIPIIPENTVLLSFKMTVGRVGITTEKMVSNEAIAHFKFDSKTPFSKEFLYLYLKTFNFDSLGSTSSIVTSINSAMIKEMLITIPSQKTFNKFDKISKLLFKKIFFNQSQIRILENLQDTLLPKLMIGTVKVDF